MIKVAIFWTYIILGIILVLFSKKISSIIYNLVLVLTDKTHVSQLFIFKTDKKNIDALFKVAWLITLTFGLVIVSFSLYILYFN